MATKAGPTRIQLRSSQKFLNKVILGLLATPGLARIVGTRLLTVYAVGRKTGRRYTVPVAYTVYEGGLVIGTPFGWVKNLRTGEPVTIGYKGKKVQADVQVYTSEEDVTRAFAALCRGGTPFAKFNKVRVDADGEPDSSDLHDAWADGSRAVKLTPRG